MRSPSHPGAAASPAASEPTIRVVGAALLLLLLGAVAGIKAGRAGASFMRDLEIVHPALADIAPWVDDPKTPRLARRVFLVIVDGLRRDYSYRLPFLDGLRRQGLDLTAQSHYPSLSRPNYVSILAGVPPVASGVRTNLHFTPVLLDTLMDRARAAGLKVATATDHALLPSLFLRPVGEGLGKVSISPDELEIDVLQDDPGSEAARRAPGALFRTAFHDARYVPWPGGFVEAGSALVAQSSELVVLLVSNVDIAGHAHGADSDEYVEATQIADWALGRVLGKVDLSEDAIVVTADHGHSDRGGHGGTEPEVLTVPLIFAGAGIASSTSVESARLIDVAPTVAALLGLPAPGHGLGKTLVDVLRLEPDAKRRRLDADRLRLHTTESTVRVAAARAEAQLLEDRAVRLGLVIGGAVFALWLGVFLIRRRVLRLDVRVLAVAIPAFFVVYYTLIGTLGQHFSPSLLPDKGHIATSLVKYALVGMGVQLLASLWVLRRHHSLSARLAAANGIAWIAILLSIIPAGFMWAFFPGPYVDLPGPRMLILIPAIQLSVAASAIDTAAVMVVELIVFATRARFRDPAPS